MDKDLKARIFDRWHKEITTFLYPEQMEIMIKAAEEEIIAEATRKLRASL